MQKKVPLQVYYLNYIIFHLTPWGVSSKTIPLSFNSSLILSAHKIHVKAIQYVKAKAQSDIINALEGELREDELYIYKRGRNAKSATVPKNANVRDYRNATGFEALVGYLYLTGKEERLNEFLLKCIEVHV